MRIYVLKSANLSKLVWLHHIPPNLEKARVFLF